MSFSCPTAFSDGPCFTLAKNWTEAQRICESHGSNLATITDAMANDQYGENGCFSNAPWNDWKCSWVGANDLKTEGAWVWPGGEAWNFTNWGASEPDTGDDQDCAAVCKGGTVPGYEGNFWVDFGCGSEEFAFCCDPTTFTRDAGTPSDQSFLASLETHPPPPPPPDPDPYDERDLCFSTKLNWEDAQKLCKSVGSNLLTIESAVALDKLSKTVHFSPVDASWGIDWQCFWTGFHDRGEEGAFEWMSQKRPGFTPPIGPFENADGAEEDCVALCQSSCTNASSPTCNDFASYGYVGTFLIDAGCTTDDSAFCCDGMAASYVAAATYSPPTPPSAPPPLAPLPGAPITIMDGNYGGDIPPENDPKDGIIIGLAVGIGVATLVACVAIVYAATRPRAGRPVTMGSKVEMTSSYTPPTAGGV